MNKRKGTGNSKMVKILRDEVKQGIWKTTISGIQFHHFLHCQMKTWFLTTWKESVLFLPFELGALGKSFFFLVLKIKWMKRWWWWIKITSPVPMTSFCEPGSQTIEKKIRLPVTQRMPSVTGPFLNLTTVENS